MYEIITWLLEPFTLVYLLFLAALLNLWRKPREKRGQLILLTAAFVGLSLVCCPTVAYLALGSLEWHYPPENKRPADAQAIVVLTAGLLAPDGPRTTAELDNDSLQRCLHAAHLYGQGPGCTVIVSGGKVDPSEPGPSTARVMADLLIKLGVKESDVTIEEVSRTTYENAVETTKLLKERQIRKALLVTDAVDMFRALRCFRKQGVELIPSPCHYRATSFQVSLPAFVANPRAALNCNRAFHEWLGMGWYWLNGRI